MIGQTFTSPSLECRAVARNTGRSGLRARPFAAGLLAFALLACSIVTAVGQEEEAGTNERAGEPTRPELSLGRNEDHDYDPPAPGSYELPVIGPAADGEVLDSEGEIHRLREVMDGKITVLSFIYTRCADPRACPYASGALYSIHGISKQDAAIAENLHLLTFSFDPEHDTPQVMADYGSGLHPKDIGAEWSFLTTRSSADLQPILEAYGQRVDRKRDPYDPLGPFYHVLRAYLIDRRGMIRNIYSFEMLDPRIVLADVRTLLLEEEAAPTGK